MPAGAHLASRNGENNRRNDESGGSGNHQDQPHGGKTKTVTLIRHGPVHYRPCGSCNGAEGHSGKTHIAPPPRVPGHWSGRKESRIDSLPIYTPEMPLGRDQGLSTLVRQAQRLILRHRVTAAWRPVLRSEERRVGKECRSRWSPYPQK